MLPVEMPKANENLLEATLNVWLVREGQDVAQEQPLCSIITDKATFELPSPGAGRVLKLLAAEHSMLPVGYVLCVLGAPGEAVPQELEACNREILAAHRGAVTFVAGVAPVGTPAAGLDLTLGVRATPVARRVARELGADLAEVARVLGLKGPVGEKDVREFAARRSQP